MTRSRFSPSLLSPLTRTKQPKPFWVIWVVACFYGLFMGPIWATVWNVLGKHVTITGKAAMFVVIGASIGDISVPVTVGALIVKVGPRVLPIQQLVSDGALIVFFCFILFVLHRIKKSGGTTRKFVELAETPSDDPHTIVEVTGSPN